MPPRSGHLIFGNLSLDLTGSVLLGAIPGVWIGAHISARASDKFIRPLLIAVLVISSVKLLGASNTVLLVFTVVVGRRSHHVDGRRGPAHDHGAPAPEESARRPA